MREEHFSVTTTYKKRNIKIHIIRVSESVEWERERTYKMKKKEFRDNKKINIKRRVKDGAAAKEEEKFMFIFNEPRKKK